MHVRLFPRLLAAILLMSVSVFPIFSQTSTTAPTASKEEKEKKQKEQEKTVLEMLDQAVGDAATLKLAQNRAIVYAIAGDLYWKFDEKRARELFRNSGNEIMQATAEAEKDKKADDDPYAQMFDFNDNRNEILPLIAKHDADLAIEIMMQTRTAKLAEALIKAAQPNAKQNGNFMDFSPEKFRVQQEIALEQRFAVLAAEQNPDKAIKLIKDSLAKGISWNVLPLLQKLNQKEEKKAASLADDVIKKIIDTDLTKKNEDMSAAIRFLQYATNPNQPKAAPKEKQFKFTDAQL
ncbi:MAG TPA: hypothetical protein VF692_07155, partial [Pyrinomonadaceae bacterium]